MEGLFISTDYQPSPIGRLRAVDLSPSFFAPAEFVGGSFTARQIAG